MSWLHNTNNLSTLKPFSMESQSVIDKLRAWVDTLSATCCLTNSSATNSATNIMAPPCTTVVDKPYNMHRAGPIFNATTIANTQHHLTFRSHATIYCTLPCPSTYMPIQTADCLCLTLDNLTFLTLPSMNELPTLIPALSAFVETLPSAHLLQILNDKLPEGPTSCNNYTRTRMSIPTPFLHTASNNPKHQTHLCWHNTLATSPVLAQNHRLP